ncbi:MAG: efflux RND transporter permease subunit [Gammaproteobacteria bacterium]|jgi:multidrug efflux pump subunit AcrB
MNRQDFGYTIAALADGAFVDEFYLDDDKTNIYLYSKAGRNASLDSLNQIAVYTAIGAVVPLCAIARIQETADTNIIRRLNSQRTVTLNIIAPDRVALGTGLEIVKRDLVNYLRETGAVPSSIDMTISGASEQLQCTQQALAAYYVVAIVIIYLC